MSDNDDLKIAIQTLGKAIELNQTLLEENAKLKNERHKFLEGFIGTVKLLKKTNIYINGGHRERTATDELLRDLENFRC